MVGSVFHVKQFTTGLRNSLEDVQKSKIMPNQVGLLRLQQATVQRVEELIQADRRIMMDSVVTALGCSHGLTYSRMHDCLKFQKMCTINRIVTGDESWVHHYQPK
jgi:hypothetical protein